MSVAPALIAGLSSQGRWIEEGSPANLVIFDPETSWAPKRSSRSRRTRRSCGMELSGQVLATIFEGRLTHQAPS